MAKHLICEELRRFIKDKIHTVLRLEILLLLHDQQSRSFNAAEIANELGFETEATQDQLTALEAIGVVIQSTTDEAKYKYNPVSATLRSTVEQLAAAYSTQRVPILSLILSEQPDRTRRFAEAFRIIRSND
jgi:predicted transcriptional regulator